MGESMNVPGVRFEGFEAQWERRKFGELVTEASRPVSLLDSDEYSLVTVKRRNEGVVHRSVLKGADILVKSYFKLEAGDYVISKRQVVHGANGLVPCSLHGSIVSNEYLVAVGNSKISAGFLALASRRPEMYQIFRLSSYGVDIEKLVFDVEDWKDRSCLVPDPTEQERIGELFEYLDSLTSLYQNKLEKLRQIKSAMLGKMFPKSGTRVPDVRFSGYEGEWDELPFDTVFLPLKNRSHSRAELSLATGEVKNIHYGDILVNYSSVVDCNTVELPSVIGASRGDFEGTLLADGDILFADAAEDESVGKAIELAGARGWAVIAGLHTIACRPVRSFSRGYLGYYFNAPAYHHQLLPLMQGTKVLSVSRSSLARTTVQTPPSLSEQAKIGEFFENLDSLIDLNVEKGKKLAQVKRSLLSKMFV